MVSPTPALPVGAGGIIVTGVGMVAGLGIVTGCCNMLGSSFDTLGSGLGLLGCGLLVPHVCGYIKGTRGFVVAELYAVITRAVNVIAAMNYGLAVLG